MRGKRTGLRIAAGIICAIGVPGAAWAIDGAARAGVPVGSSAVLLGAAAVGLLVGRIGVPQRPR
jgi:hypothetical protein